MVMQEIPMEFMEDHGSKFDKTVTLEEEDSEVCRVKIGGNLFVGFGFDWRDFAESHNIGIGQVIVFTLVARSRFLVQIYKPGNPSSIAPKSQTSASVEVEQGRNVHAPVAPKVEDDDDIEVCVAEDWLEAKASRSKAANPILPCYVKVEKVFSETSSGGQASGAPGKHGKVDVKGRQKCGIVPKTENVLEGMDVSDGIVEASDSSRRKRKFGGADSASIHGHSLRRTPPNKCPVLTTPAAEVRDQASPGGTSSDNAENGDSDASSPSTSDSAWSPGNSCSGDGRKRSAEKYVASSDSNTEEEDDDEEDVEDANGVEDDRVLNKITGKKRLFVEGSSSLDQVKRKRGRPPTKMKTETDLPNGDDGMNGRSGLLVEGYIVKRHGHDWHKAGTKRGRTYVSKRRAVTEVEKVKTLEKARQVQISHPSFLKQLHKDCCYRSLQLVSLH